MKLTRVLEVFLAFLQLGFTSFGGPVAHLGYFHREFVSKRKWAEESTYADIVALCQFLPGPASSQVGIAIGLSRAGLSGGLAAWLGFTLPSAILLVLFALGISHFGNTIAGGWLHGLKIAAAAVVAQAIWNMAVKLCPDKERVVIAILSSVAVTLLPATLGQVSTLIAAGLIGCLCLKHPEKNPSSTSFHTPISQKTGVVFLTVFFILLLILPLLAASIGNHSLILFSSFFRAGSLVFGGGHVVLPLLQTIVVPPGWVSSDAFMAGYGAAQAIPGPLFTFTAYLGAISKVSPTGWLGATICLIAAFAPSYFLVVGTLPFWEKLRHIEHMQLAMQGIGAAVVGLLLSAFYHPVWTSAILSRGDFALLLIEFVLLMVWKAPTWSIVLISAVAGQIL